MSERTPWRRSSRSLGGNCVELARTDNRVAIRDSKNPGQILDIPATQVAVFLRRVGTGRG
nr:DUF397 domain-containing protein [Actinokineospora globicatena]